jgi:hypothetical protein
LSFEKNLKEIKLSSTEMLKEGDFVLDIFKKSGFSEDFLQTNQSTIKSCIDIITTGN